MIKKVLKTDVWVFTNITLIVKRNKILYNFFRKIFLERINFLMEANKGILIAYRALEKYHREESLPMGPSEGYALTFQIMSIIKYLFIVVAVVIIISTFLSLFNFKNKKIHEMFNYRDTTNGLTTLFTITLLCVPIIVICTYRAVDFLRSVATNVDYPPLVTKVIMPICSLKMPDFSVIINEFQHGKLYFLPIIIITIILILIKMKDTASKTMLILFGLTLILLLITYRLYMIYYDLFEIRILF